MDDVRPLSQATRAEIASQPACWERALELAREGVPGLPAPGERVLILGCGTSYYVGVAYAWLRESVGHGESDALVASELPPILRKYDRVVAISRSGTSSELLEALRRVRAEQPASSVTALLGEQGTPLAALADSVIDLSFADEASVVQTRFPTTQLVLLRATLLGASDPTLSALPQSARMALVSRLPPLGIRQIVVLGNGWGSAIAVEAALKVRESAGAWAESYAVGEYRHGPIAACGRGTLVWGLGKLPDDIVSVVLGAGGQVEDGCGEPLVELIRLHRYAVELAAQSGLDADAPHLLSRSVVFDA